MKKPYMTGSQPSDQPNEPKIYPGDAGIKASPDGKANKSSEGFAWDAKVKMPDQLHHKTNAIPQEHIFGKPSKDGGSMHQDTKSLSPHKQPEFSGAGMKAPFNPVLKPGNPTRTSMKPRLPKPKA